MTNAVMGNRLHDFPVSHPKQCILMAFALEPGWKTRSTTLWPTVRWV